MEYYLDLIRISIVSVFSVLCILLLRIKKLEQNVFIGLLFIVSLAFYTLLGWDTISGTWLHSFFEIGGTSIPFLFWVLSKAIFDDGFRLRPIHVLIYVVAFSSSLFFSENEGISLITKDSVANAIGSKVHQFISMIFVVLGLIEAFKNRAQDLLESRIRFRYIFVVIVAVILGMTLLAEISLSKEQLQTWPDLIQKITILGITIFFTSYILEFKSGFFIEIKNDSPAPEVETDPHLADAMHELINENKIYLQEGLTIRHISERIGQKEYKIRRYINQKMGFKNFNDFLNSYRIQEACEILLDNTKSDLTILEIAYQLGYSSIGPFNAAFKAKTGKTPTQYRKEG